MDVCVFRKPHLAWPHPVRSKDQSSKFVPAEAGLDISDGEFDPGSRWMLREGLWAGLRAGLLLLRRCDSVLLTWAWPHVSVTDWSNLLLKELWSNSFLRRVPGSEQGFGSGRDPQITLPEVALFPRQPCPGLGAAPCILPWSSTI